MGPTTPDVAVTSVTTVYNGAGHLAAAIGSLRDQTLDDIQIVVVVDGSGDDSEAVARAQAAEDPRVEVIAMPRIGRSAALNVGVAAARAPFVAILDADDLAHPRRLEIQRSWLADQGDRVAGVGADVVAFRGPAGPLPPVTAEPPYVAVEVTSHLRRHNPIAHSAVLLRRAALEHVGGYDTARTRQVDYDLYIRLAAAGYRLHALDLPLAALRTHAGQNYLAGKQLRYRASSLAMQATALRHVEGDRSDLLYLPARAGYLLARTAAPRLFEGWSGTTRRVAELTDADG
jgi:glycosyltransferase involved in cell wall biosynthesis